MSNATSGLLTRQDMQALRAALDRKWTGDTVSVEADTLRRALDFIDGKAAPDPAPVIDAARRGLAAVLGLLTESYGVAGLHRNGDLASWGELRTGGRFETWLLDFDAACEALGLLPARAKGKPTNG